GDALTSPPTSTSIAKQNTGGVSGQWVALSPPEAAPPVPHKKTSKAFPSYARPREGPDFLGTGLLEHGLEVGLRRLQSMIVQVSRSEERRVGEEARALRGPHPYHQPGAEVAAL